MEVKAILKHLKISAHKVRLVAKLIKGMKVKEAENQLVVLPQRSALPILKLLKSAIANAVNNFQLSPDNLYISLIKVDEGPALKRFRARARGIAALIKKRSSHLTLILKEVVSKREERKQKPEKIMKLKKVVPETEKKLVEEKQKLKKMPFRFKIRKEQKEIREKMVLPKQKFFRRKAI